MPLEFVDRVVVLHEALTESGVPHALGGGLALAYHAEPRGIYEIDLSVFLPPSAAGEVIGRLSRIGVRYPKEEAEGGVPPPVAGFRCAWDDTHVDVFFAYDEEFSLDEAYVQRWFLHLRGGHGWPRVRRFLDLRDEMRPSGA